MPKSKKTKSKKKHQIIKGSVPEIRLEPKRQNILFVFAKNTWKIIVVLGVIIGIIVSIEPLKRLFLSPKERFEEDATVQGDIKPILVAPNNDSVKISENGDYYISEIISPLKLYKFNEGAPNVKGLYIKDYKRLWYINFFLGEKQIKVFTADLSKGISILNPLYNGCTDQKLNLFVVNDRLYVSTEFKDIEKEELAGFLNYNHWVLYKQNMLDFSNDDERLEVKDKQNHIIFSIKYQHTDIDKNQILPMVFIAGYFISNTSVLIMRNNNPGRRYVCIEKSSQNWKGSALGAIDSINTIFPEKY